MDEYVRTKIYAEYVAVGDLIKVQAGEYNEWAFQYGCRV